MKFAYSENIRIVNKLSTVFSTINESMYFDVLEYMAMCYFRLGMYEDALEYSSNALLFYKDLVLALRIKAESLAFLDNTYESRQIFINRLRKHKLLEC
jgi:tetratricopeptide (TPR) repeat protein